MLDFNPKTNIQKYPVFSCCYNLFSVNVSDFYYFTGISLLNARKFGP